MKSSKVYPWFVAFAAIGLLCFLSSCEGGRSSRYGGGYGGRRGDDSWEQIAKLILILPHVWTLLWLVWDYISLYVASRKGKSITQFGEQMDQLIFPIGGKGQWSLEEASLLSEDILAHVHSDLKTRISDPMGTYNNPDLGISSGVSLREREVIYENNLRKPFLKATYSHHSGHEMSYFLQYQLVGNYLVSHNLVYLKGKNRLLKLVLFWLFMPKLLFFKMIWKRRSILPNYINVIDPSFFDSMDLNAFWTTAHEAIMESTEAILKEKGLLTEEIQTILNQHITNHNVSNTQNVRVSGSGNTLQGFNQANSSN